MMTVETEIQNETIPRIQQLPPLLANQIAAGEVIERPASVLKELLENSIDAGSTQIDVWVERSGVRLIKVRDNGSGIEKEDLQLAIAQHATSKIHQLEDLEGISSLGFRGEALASVAAVSKLTIASKTKESESGWTLAGKPIAHPQGTTIEMQELFYNTPARRKFLKAEKTEMLQIESLFKKMALSHFEVGFSLNINGKLSKNYPKCSKLDQFAYEKRVIQVCGQAFVKNAHFINAKGNGLRLWGWLGNPKAAKAHRDNQYFYVNRRMVKDKVINHAVRQAYLEHCELGRHPEYVLFLDLPCESVDVNVHPTKFEVRFREARQVHEFLLSGLQQGLGKTISFLPISPSLSISPNPAFRKGGQAPLTPLLSGAFLRYFLIKNQFLIVEKSENIILIDIALAQKQIIYNKLMSDFEVGNIPSKPLLVPKSYTVGKHAENAALHQKKLEQIGFFITQSGPQQVMVRKIQKILDQVDLDNLILIVLKNSEKETKELLRLIAEQSTQSYQWPDEAIQGLLNKIENLSETVKKQFQKTLSYESLKNLIYSS